MAMLEIDGSRYSGSGTIVRQAVMFAALTRQAVHIVRARVRCPTPGLRPQHIRVVTGETLDRYAADQVIPFAALVVGESRFRIPHSPNIESNAWLAQVFLRAEVTIAGQVLSITGVGMRTPWATAARKE